MRIKKINEDTAMMLEIVKILIGNIHPVGETRLDDIRYQNLKVMCTLVDALLNEIYEVIDDKDRNEYSVKRAGEYASEQCRLLMEKISENVGI